MELANIADQDQDGSNKTYKWTEKDDSKKMYKGKKTN